MKPLKGIIKEWCITNNRVFGECVISVDDPRPGGTIRTSEIVTIMSIPGSHANALKLETQNSVYILI